MIASTKPLIAIVMGSPNDAEVMLKASEILDQFGICHEVKVMSAHRTPARCQEFAASARQRGLRIVIAAAGMAAHLAGVMAALTGLPVLGVPLEGKLMGGLDALLSTVQMPRGVPVATFAVGSHGAVNAALFAVQMLAMSDPALQKALDEYREAQTRAVPDEPPMKA
ncbi:MAG: 5-(carboxyamino)imidazole ribonucleotide mutase [Phycisphaeraceae bacterium]|nr:5-(carboxyamino)imidazole ribonucleotide mutase [Phycisphaeraceae bacterium]